MALTNKQCLFDDQKDTKTTITKLPTDLVDIPKPTLSRVSVDVAEEASTDGAMNVQCLSDDQNHKKTTNMKMPMDFAIALETLAVKSVWRYGPGGTPEVDPRLIYSQTWKLRTTSIIRLCTTGYAPSRYSGSMSSVGESCRSRGMTSQQTDAGAGLSGLCGQ